MKQQKIMILIVLVVGVWGLIGYRIYEQLREEPAKTLPRRKQVVPVASEESERYTLSLAYPDPFLKGAERPVVMSKVQPVFRQAQVARVTTVARPTVQAVSVNWSKIRYGGVMYNNTRKRKMATLTINGAEHFLQEGETGDGLRVLAITADSVQVSIEGNTRYLRKQ